MFARICFLLLLSFVAFALTDSEVESKVQETLNQRHPDQDENWYRKLGPNAPRVLIKMYDESQNTFHRMRLMDGLRSFKDEPIVAQFYRRELEKNTQSAERRNLVRNLVLHSGEQAIADLEPLINDADSQMRLQIGELLRDMKGAESERLFDRLRKSEKEQWILAAWEKKPPTLKPLPIVSSSEDAGPLKFRGEWKGYLIYPKEKSLRSAQAHFRATLNRGVLDGASLTWRAEKIEQNVTLKPTKVQSRQMEGSAMGLDKNKAIPFLGQLVDTSGEQQLLLQVPGQGLTFIGHRVGN